MSSGFHVSFPTKYFKICLLKFSFKNTQFAQHGMALALLLQTTIFRQAWRYARKFFIIQGCFRKNIPQVI